MSEQTDRRAALEARNAAMREQVANLTTRFHEQMADLKDAQSRAMTVTGEAVSPDGLVTAVVDAAGTITRLDFAVTAFNRSTPEKLSRTVVETIVAATARARTQVNESMAVTQQSLGMDLNDLIEGAPPLRDLAPTLPPPPTPPTAPPPAPTRRSRPPEDDDEDFGNSSFMR
ncbi:DNA-binding protein YbaB [Actinoalloteichus hoggarensis]|uniref:Nucleoid-associated protein YbaB n=1 Tax=Actinoalloteichus hoggarensis TaxID=1470176 RepID=A0A221VZE1_9PSEU|nr:YbaB/EbfC family nucleoid-associated protein [Actinoalloteichus hoggarensis]ASO18878.1 Nucleoid-associated protein YbaB [Actinoalloteichus hoggarensis]MBB5920113.1 DNA-binding protein YbaB [Actinoalloteichus hoggarensis]